MYEQILGFFKIKKNYLLRDKIFHIGSYYLNTFGLMIQNSNGNFRFFYRMHQKFTVFVAFAYLLHFQCETDFFELTFQTIELFQYLVKLQF